MEQLKVIGTEDDVLVLATESGERFSLALDDVLRIELRKVRREREGEQKTSTLSPRDIQAHIRSGLSAQEVAELLGARVEDVARFEGPVLAEREHIVGLALAVPVLLGSDLEHDVNPTFGAAVRAKLAEAAASGERWTSWKEQTGWIVKLEFTSAEVDHDARWSFDPRRSTLSPLNADAIQLSRQGSLPEGLIPRLRALDSAAPKDDSRFDSGAFGPRRLPDADLDAPELPSPTAPAVQQAAIKRAAETSVTSAETADLLEALRRRRGQREPLPGMVDGDSDRGQSPVALFDALEPGYDEAPPLPEPIADVDRPAVAEAGRRKGRPSMPSWDEIVFGARTDE
ncbi:septation protein SepH [Microbacterium terricola]|uniref:DNA-binding protein n=1 Tax=Microbacterium terricola TaxID=344163 RepID=A0ABM8DYQ6_9MICO|nr:septation protein SepH [Microbacterium terricola]UYK38662.1 septation protein SepH [Microbacterium terricola]BDV30650.1 DNA-binding protein [Microbacterium terricola]